MRPRYTGPLVVIARNRGGAYILCELDGSVLDRPMAAFRLVPYFSRTAIPLPNDVLDIEEAKLRQMQEASSLGDDDEDLGDQPEDLQDEESDSDEDQ